MKAEGGYSLLEVLTSIVIVALIGSGIAGALGTSAKTLIRTDMNQKARNFAQYEMELQVYPVISSSGLTSTLYPGLTASIAALSVPGHAGEQQVSITITGNNINPYILQDYKAQ